MRARLVLSLTLVTLATLATLTAACGGTPPPCPTTPPPPPPPSAPAASAPAPPPAPPHDADVERLHAYAATRGFRLGAPDAMTPTPDGKAVLFLRSGPRDPKQSLFETDRATGKTRVLLSPDRLLAGPETLSVAERARRERMRTRTTGFTDLEISEDGARVLLGLSGRAFVYTRATGEARELPTGGAGTDLGAVIDPHLSHDGKRVAYVRGHDLYVIDVASGRETALTRGGTETLSRGAAEFIAAEELDRTRGFWWSPDDARVLYEEADTSKVEVLQIADPAHPERAPNATRYPRAGTANAKVRFGFVGSHGGPTTWAAVDAAKWAYVATVRWEKGGPPTLYALDRAQREGALLAADPATGKTVTLVAEHDAAWLDVDPSVPRWLPDGRFLWSSERGGAARELELHDKTGALVRTLLPGKQPFYRDLYDVDGKAGVAYVGAGLTPDVLGVYSVEVETGAHKDVVYPMARSVIARFGAGHDVFAARETTLTAMPEYWVQSVHEAKGPAIPAVTETPAVMPRVEITTASDMEVAIVRPHGFVEGRRYPVIDSAYGGPGVSVVGTSALRYVLDQWIADRTGAIVVAIDAQGTLDRGRAWERAIDHKLGTVPIEGHIRALQALGAAHPEMDMTRIGVRGWSFGGYFAAMAVLTHPEVYKVAFAGAPVADWHDYDTCYTERYLGLPGEDAAAYDAASLLTAAAAKATGPASPTSPLLIVHGTADDNVYFFHSLKLAGALEKAGRPFEFVPVPDMTHIPRDPASVEAVFKRAADFLEEHLR